MLVYYGLSEGGDLPNSGSQQDWLGRAAEIISGDNEAAAAGFERLREPTQAEIQVAYTAVNTLYMSVPAADLAYDLASAKMDNESERRIMRGYGFTFVTRNNSAEDTVEESLTLEEEEIIDNG